MTATHRTKATRDASHDYYRTPRWCVSALIPHLPMLAPNSGVNTPVFDPCAGDGAILEAFCEEDEDESDRQLGGLEIQPDLVDKIKPSFYRRGGTFQNVVAVGDALSPAPWGCTGHVVMNPPFNQAEAFIRRAIFEVDGHGGTVYALLRLGFLEGQVRQAFHLEHPSNVYVLPRRPSFTGGGTDASAYAWFEWSPWPHPLDGPARQEEARRAHGHWTILDVTTDCVRAPWGKGTLRIGANAFEGIDVSVPNTYPDGENVSAMAAAELAHMAVTQLGLLTRLKRCLEGGVPRRNLYRVFGSQIEARVIALMQSGVRPVETRAPSVPKTKARKSKKPPESPALENEEAHR